MAETINVKAAGKIHTHSYNMTSEQWTALICILITRKNHTIHKIYHHTSYIYKIHIIEIKFQQMFPNKSQLFMKIGFKCKVEVTGSLCKSHQSHDWWLIILSHDILLLAHCAEVQQDLWSLVAQVTLALESPVTARSVSCVVKHRKYLINPLTLGLLHTHRVYTTCLTTTY